MICIRMGFVMVGCELGRFAHQLADLLGDPVHRVAWRPRPEVGHRGTQGKGVRLGGCIHLSRCEGWDKRPGVFRGNSLLRETGKGKKRSIPYPARGRRVSSMKKAEPGIMAPE